MLQSAAEVVPQTQRKEGSRNPTIRIQNKPHNTQAD